MGANTNGSNMPESAEPLDAGDAAESGATSQIWGGRFAEAPDDLVRSYTASLQTDLLISRHDIAGSRAHARMLGQQEIIPSSDVTKILEGLDLIEEEIASGSFPLRPELEDIHMNIEARLGELIGEDAAGRLHTARSRNDQVALDSRMFVRDAIVQSVGAIRGLQIALVDLAERNIEVVMPGYTHLQRAQPILFAHALLAYFEMLDRDAGRFVDAFDRADVMPLGSAALAGAAYPLNRESVAKELGFSRISQNSIDAVADRDYMLEYAAAAAICMTHISRLCEDLILWASAEFGFVEFSERYSTGSSIMPQKKNPDIAELARGRTGRVLGNLVGLLTMLKGLPLAYNRDLQEDKPALFDSVETLISTLSVLTGAIATATVHGDRARETVNSDRFILATDYADYLTRKGLPFREAHHVVGALVKQCETEDKALAELTLAELKAQHRLFEKDAVGMTVEQALAARDVPGGTAPKRVTAAIAEARNRIQISVDGREEEPS